MKDNNEIIQLIPKLDSLRILLKDKDYDEEIELSVEASNYLLSHKWCTSIEEGWLAQSWGVLAVFLFKIKSDYVEVDDYVWMVVGDIPSVYIDIQSATNIDDVLSCYIYIMEDWVKTVETKGDIELCYPVEVPPTLEYAEMLKDRLAFIKAEM